MVPGIHALFVSTVRNDMWKAKPEHNLAVAFAAKTMEDPDAIALVVDEDRWTRAEISEMAAASASTLLKHGVGAGDCVVAQYDTCAEDIGLAVASAQLGATFLPIPKRMGVREINFILSRSKAKFFAYAGDEIPAGVAPPPGASTCSTRAAVESAPARLAPPEFVPDRVAVIGVTSGSTGQPKGVMHGWSGVAWAAERMRALADVKDGESILATGAGAGAPGFTFFTYFGLVHGATIVRTARWDPARVLELAHVNDCVWSTMVTTMLQMLIDVRPQVLGTGKLNTMRAVTVGGSFMSRELIQRARKELGVQALRMYAMAECMSHSSTVLTDTEEERDCFDGRPGPGAELAAFNDRGERLPCGAAGEIGMRGPSLLLGYLGDPHEKARLMTSDGFFLSGDIGKVTESGFVKIVGRKKDMIIRGGFNIDPAEVEELIRHHAAVSKVAVIGYADPVFGERACAVVELKTGAGLLLADLVSFLGSLGLSKEKMPERLEIRERLPLSPDGKILKGQLRVEIGADPGEIAR